MIAKTIAAAMTMMVITTAFAGFKNGKVILVIEVEVRDFVEWKTKFDAGAPVREQAGIKVLSVCTSVEQPGHVLVIEEAENAQAAHDFITLLKNRQKDGASQKLSITMYDKAD